MSLYENMANTALKQINDKGRSISIVSPGTDQVYDPATDSFTAGTDTALTVKGLFTQFAKKDIDGELIKTSDKRVLIAASSLAAAPETGDKITDGGITYNVMNTDTVQPGDTAILYMVQVRR